MGTKSYKCPSCGAGIHYKPEHKKFSCDYCLSEFTEKELDRNKEEREQHDYSNADLNSYSCKSCGANVVTDETTTATFCYYCHNPVIISSRLKAEFKPDKIIPFSIDKKTAQESFLEWAGKKKFIPKDFTSESHLEKITGVYIPYWWANCKADVDYLGEGRNIRIWRVSDIEYTETKIYNVVRQGSIDMNNVEEMAFSKIEKRLMDGIGPYNTNEVLPFSMPYLSGFFAEQYDINKDEARPIIENQVGMYSKYLLDETIRGFNHIKNVKDHINISVKDWSYALLPAWILTYSYKGKTYVYAVNGQTGKSFGELPISKAKVATAFGAISGITTAALLLGGHFIW